MQTAPVGWPANPDRSGAIQCRTGQLRARVVDPREKFGASRRLVEENAGVEASPDPLPRDGGVWICSGGPYGS